MTEVIDRLAVAVNAHDLDAATGFFDEDWCGSRLRTAATVSSLPGGLAGRGWVTGSVSACSAACSACTRASAAAPSVAGMWAARISTAIAPVTPCRWTMSGRGRERRGAAAGGRYKHPPAR